MARTLRTKRQEAIPKQVVELDEERSVVGTDGVNDVWKASVLLIIWN